MRLMAQVAGVALTASGIDLEKIVGNKSGEVVSAAGCGYGFVKLDPNILCSSLLSSPFSALLFICECDSLGAGMRGTTLRSDCEMSSLHWAL